MDKNQTMQHEKQGHRENHEPQGVKKGDHSNHNLDSMEHDDHNSGHGTDHSGHEMMFRIRFWWSLLLTIPVLLYSSALQSWLSFSMPTFPGSEWVSFVFSLIVFGYGGIPFLKMAVPEIQDRKPGMMTLISLAISVALNW